MKKCLPFVHLVFIASLLHVSGATALQFKFGLDSVLFSLFKIATETSFIKKENNDVENGTNQGFTRKSLMIGYMRQNGMMNRFYAKRSTTLIENVKFVHGTRKCKPESFFFYKI